ncbi:hypothetical protein AAHC03_04964 [Spirometra sp. Aus1]
MDLEDVEEMSTDELALAQNTRRKSTRRSLLPIPVVSHSNSSSPKVLVRRRSLGWPLHGISVSPRPSVTIARKSLDLQPDSFREHHKTPDPLNNFKPAKPDLPPLNDQPPSQVSECPILARVDQPPSKVPESSHSSNLVDPCVCSDQRTVVGSAEELYDRYVEELNEWPKFLSGLEDLANHHVEVNAISNEAIDENPVLAPFSRYLYPESQGSLTSNPTALQQRIRKLYRLCVCSLLSLNRRRKEQHLFLSGIRSDWEEWCTRERVKLMPSTRNTDKFPKKEIFNRLSSLSAFNGSDQLSP